MRRRTLLASAVGALTANAIDRMMPGRWGSGSGSVAFAQVSPGGPQGRWIPPLAPVPQPTEELAGAAANGKLYATQGLLPGFRPAGLVYEYDPAVNTWTKKQPMAHATHHAAVAVFNNRIYVFGGFVLPQSGPPGWVAVNDAWEYEPASDAWRRRAPMPTARGAAGAAVVNGRIYVVGGAGPLPNSRDQAIRPGGPQQSLGTVEEYDPVANRWRPRRPMPTARNHLAVEGAGGRVYAIGGRLGGAFIIAMPGNVDLTQEYDPVTDVWLTKAAMPTARSGVSSAALGGFIYVAGGELRTYEYLAAYRAFEAYDPAGDVWYRLPPMPIPRHEAAMAALGNRIHVIGGDVQSAIVPPPAGVNFVAAQHDAFEVAA
ncbi:MAG TPA: kelch repeat-containing protein [bacterium]|nr:kelch repeat-containing protein [bacterium]